MRLHVLQVLEKLTSSLISPARAGRFRCQNWHIFDGPFCARYGIFCTSNQYWLIQHCPYIYREYSAYCATTGSFSTVSLYSEWSAYCATTGSFSTVSLYSEWSAYSAVTGSFNTEL